MARGEATSFERHAEKLAEKEWGRVQSIPHLRELYGSGVAPNPSHIQAIIQARL